MKIEMRAPALAALSGDVMAALDPGGRIVWANAAWRRVLGWAPDELAGVPLVELLHPDDAVRGLALARAGEDGTEAALRLRTPSGSMHRMAFGAMAADGLVYVCGRDATQALEAEQELRAAEDRFRSVTEATAEAIVMGDARGRITFANPSACRIFGWEPHELLGQPLTMLMPERYRERHVEGLSRYLATGRPQLIGRTIEVEGLRRDGSEFPLELSLGTWQRGGRRAFTGILRDVTARRETQRALELWGARYHALVANLPQVIVTLFDTDMNVLVMEGGQLTRQGLTRDRFEGKPLAEAISGAAYAALGPRVRAALAGEPQQFEFRAGDGLDYEVHVAPLTGDDERIIGAIGVARDITALRQAQRAVEERALELERSNAELAEFAYVASHDLSEPLRMITSYLQLLRRRHGDALQGEADEFVRHAADGATRMRALIEDLLAYSRAGRSDRAAERVDMGELVAGVAGTVVAAASEPRPIVEWGDLPVVAGESAQLAQLLQNLVSNGVKFVAAGTVAHVRVSAERDGGCWRFAVDDNGIGIEPRHAERIFGMFQRLHTREAFPGTGIGLAIARKVVERHGGRIWAEPRPEGGTRMAFTLPA